MSQILPESAEFCPDQMKHFGLLFLGHSVCATLRSLIDFAADAGAKMSRPQCDELQTPKVRVQDVGLAVA